MTMDLIIGENSQVSHFLPNDYIRISSRNIDYEFIKKNKWSKIFLCFAEQRTFNSNLLEKDFMDINVHLTSIVIDEVKNYTDKIIIYGTSELWNNHNGPINIGSPIDYKYSPYIKSKHRLYEELFNRRERNDWKNVIILHPFNFNSTKRREGFLFEKIFSALLNNQPTKVGNLNINRDIIHVKYLVGMSINAQSDMIIGSGKLTNVRLFIESLFTHFNKSFDQLVIENKHQHSSHIDNTFWLDTEIKYDNLFIDTVNEISMIIKKNQINEL